MFEVNINGKVLSLNDKTRIIDLVEKTKRKDYFIAKVNNRLRELTYEIDSSCDVELLDGTNSDAIKVYETSLRYIVAMAFYNTHPDYKIKISYGISRSLLISIIYPIGIKVDNKLINEIKDEMDRIVSLDLPFDRYVTSKEFAIELFNKNHENEKLDILKFRPDSGVHFVKCDDYNNYMYFYQVPSSGYIKSYKLFAYGNQIVVQYPRYENKGEIPPFVDAPTLSKVLKDAHNWARLCDADYVSKINNQIKNDSYIDFINLCETKHNDMLAELGNIISSNIDDIKLICIAGPSSSGKTTFSNRLKIELRSKGINPIRISLDMYYKERDLCPKDENGDYDFESIEALDVERFNNDMQRLINGEEVILPKFDFKIGKPVDGEKAKLSEKTPIIIEGIHALNNALSYSIPNHQKYKIYISPLFQINLDNHNPISYTDIRLIRRIVRDSRTRGTNAERTISMWPSVRRGEFKWIYPYQEGCNYVFNSGLTYEICVMKKYALPALKEIDPSSPYYISANRLIKFLKYFNDMDESMVPCNSLLREFIGGSCFKDV